MPTLRPAVLVFLAVALLSGSAASAQNLCEGYTRVSRLGGNDSWKHQNRDKNRHTHRGSHKQPPLPSEPNATRAVGAWWTRRTASSRWSTESWSSEVAGSTSAPSPPGSEDDISTYLGYLLAGIGGGATRVTGGAGPAFADASRAKISTFAKRPVP